MTWKEGHQSELHFLCQFSQQHCEEQETKPFPRKAYNLVGGQGTLKCYKYTELFLFFPIFFYHRVYVEKQDKNDNNRAESNLKAQRPAPPLPSHSLRTSSLSAASGVRSPVVRVTALQSRPELLC